MPDCEKALNLGRNNSKKKKNCLPAIPIADTAKPYAVSIEYTLILFMESYLQILERMQDFALKDEKVLRALEKIKRYRK